MENVLNQYMQLIITVLVGNIDSYN